VAGKVSSRFVAAEEVVAYQLAKQAVSDLIASQHHLRRAAVFRPQQQAQCAFRAPNQHELQSLTMARVDEAFLRPAHFVDASTDILSVVRLFQAQRTTNVLVRD
jgi:CBS domain-containing protein